MKILICLSLFSFITLAQNCFENNDKTSMSCIHQKIQIKGIYAQREILFATPQSDPPKAGYPVVLFFQGSFFPMEFKRSKALPFGGYNEILTMKMLLDNGFAIIAPRAGAGLFWQSNLNGINYNISSDKYLVDKILSEIERETFGKLDINNLFAMGISSGGYMTDRMAHSHREYQFNALAIASASYAKCGGPYCPLPNTIYPNHPATLFLHGKIDPVVPIFTMRKYAKLLKKNNVEVQIMIHSKTGHAWIDQSPIAITQWFKKYLK